MGFRTHIKREEDAKKRFCAKIKALREFSEMTIKRFSEESVIPSYGSIERGKTDPRLSDLVKICHVYDLTLAELLEFSQS